MIATLAPPETPFTTGLTPWAQCLPDHISPTAAKAYLSCSLKFYFERVACIRKATPAAAKPDAANAAFDHAIQLVSYQLLMEAATGETPPSLDLVFLVKTKKPQTIRVTRPPADARRKQRVVALLETAVEGIASNRYHPQSGMQCS